MLKEQHQWINNLTKDDVRMYVESHLQDFDAFKEELHQRADWAYNKFEWKSLAKDSSDVVEEIRDEIKDVMLWTWLLIYIMDKEKRHAEDHYEELEA